MSSSLSKKHKRGTAKNKGDIEAPPLKKTCIQCSEDPDVTIVVGGQEFMEYRHSLRCWSSYFDRALASGMQEEKQLKFEFPDRCPKEWEWIVSLMAPMPTERVHMFRIKVALDWFDYLGCKGGLEECDRVMFDYVPEMTKATPATAETLQHLETALRYDLKRSILFCVFKVKSRLEEKPSRLNREILTSITGLVKNYAECRQQLFDPLRALLPTSFSKEQAEILLDNDMMAEVIYLEIQNRGQCKTKSPKAGRDSDSFPDSDSSLDSDSD